VGYLTETIADLRQSSTAQFAPAQLWREDSKADWLLDAPGSPAARRALMVDAIRCRMNALSDRLGRCAIERALCAMLAVPRDRFVCPLIDDLAYLPMSIEIGLDQVISHPELVAVLAAAADPRGGRVLDVGTGSGYQAAVLAKMSAHVTSVEILAPHARLARHRLNRFGYDNVEVIAGDAAAPGICAPRTFDAIVVAAGSSEIPPDFLSALKVGGRLVMPVGPSQDDEHLVLAERVTATRWRHTTLRPARFVPLTGKAQRQMADQGLSGTD
jgi:protein-L-isoaspartate(D-aspartate) O-methyltransferase